MELQLHRTLKRDFGVDAFQLERVKQVNFAVSDVRLHFRTRDFHISAPTVMPHRSQDNIRTCFQNMLSEHAFRTYFLIIRALPASRATAMEHSQTGGTPSES